MSTTLFILQGALSEYHFIYPIKGIKWVPLYSSHKGHSSMNITVFIQQGATQHTLLYSSHNRQIHWHRFMTWWVKWQELKTIHQDKGMNWQVKKLCNKFLLWIMQTIVKSDHISSAWVRPGKVPILIDQKGEKLHSSNPERWKSALKMHQKISESWNPAVAWKVPPMAKLLDQLSHQCHGGGGGGGRASYSWLTFRVSMTLPWEL